MRVKYHKIPKVEKSVCTAEQMIAYNIAWRNQYLLSDYEKAENKKQLAVDTTKQMMSNYRNAYDYTGKYNEEAIEYALLHGIETYASTKCRVLFHYSEVSEMFPIPEGNVF